jgi:hypothetical protein
MRRSCWRGDETRGDRSKGSAKRTRGAAEGRQAGEKKKTPRGSNAPAAVAGRRAPHVNIVEMRVGTTHRYVFFGVRSSSISFREFGCGVGLGGWESQSDAIFQKHGSNGSPHAGRGRHKSYDSGLAAQVPRKEVDTAEHAALNRIHEIHLHLAKSSTQNCQSTS